MSSSETDRITIDPTAVNTAANAVCEAAEHYIEWMSVAHRGRDAHNPIRCPGCQLYDAVAHWREVQAG